MTERDLNEKQENDNLDEEKIENEESAFLESENPDKKEKELTYTEITEIFENFFTSSYETKLLEYVEELGCALIDYEELDKFDARVAELLLEKPEDIITLAETALANHPLLGDKDLKVRFKNLPESLKVEIRNIRSDHLGRFLVVDSIIKQASEVRPEIIQAVFECNVCGNRIVVAQNKDTLRKPAVCPACGNKKGFDIVERKMRDVQRIEVEELPDELGDNPQPRKIGVFLRDDLVDPKFQKKIVPGRKIRIYGILKDMPLPQAKGETKRRDIYIEANYVESIEKEFEEVELTEEDLQEIEKLAKDPDIYEKLVKSIAPSIYGYETIKLAIALQLFGGVRKVRKDGVTTRGDIHILLVGDPGAGKSQILKYVANLAPKARYVVGKSASGAGLTATVVRDEFVRGWALEAGALVLANKGIACIDELDKMGKEDRSAMHEVMEQQTVTVSKANVQATLQAQTTILGAANPKYGRFDPYASSLVEQIDLPETLLSRFDLIFPIIDRPDKERDTKLVKHILKMHEEPEETEPAIERDLFRKYISYARKHIKPKMTRQAEKMIEEFYVGLRNKYNQQGEVKAVPITTRQLEAIIRLAEASAKVRLSEKVTKRDVNRAINLVKEFMQTLGYDPETGVFDIDRIETGTTTSQRNKMMLLLKLIEDLEKRLPEGMVPVEDIIEIAKQHGMDDVEKLLARLEKMGDIYKPRHGFVKRA
ncbi:MAG: minichromosome maintenance protein MCM [Candidatus Nanohaloarchaeota archaeon]|nr:minichromosome maintenance protein MCM [Candidatus Nanohaloarchaeota archaeon]